MFIPECFLLISGIMCELGVILNGGIGGWVTSVFKEKYLVLFCTVPFSDSI